MRCEESGWVSLIVIRYYLATIVVVLQLPSLISNVYWAGCILYSIVVGIGVYSLFISSRCLRRALNFLSIMLSPF